MTDWTREEQLAQVLIDKHLTIATAESCTGGLIAKRLTDRSGSSEYFMGGAVVYSNDAKNRLLGVDAHMMKIEGSVSRLVAEAMAVGARTHFNTDLALSVTGIAGPTGGTETKPVGLTFIGVSAADGVWVKKFVFEGDRSENRAAAAEAALQMMLDYLDGTL